MADAGIDLPKLAGEAGATVGLLIAIGILQSWLTSRYVPAFNHYRALCQELRGYRDQTKRRGSLRDQIDAYRRRLRLLSVGSELLSWAILCAVLTVCAAAASTIAAALPWLQTVGIITLFAAFLLVILAMALEMRENRMDRKAIASEAVDLDEVNEGADR